MESAGTKRKRPYVKPVMKRLAFAKEGIWGGGDDPCRWVSITEKKGNSQIQSNKKNK